MSLSPEVAEIIRRKKTQYCRFADTRQFQLFEKIALPSATFKFVGPDGSLVIEGGVEYYWDNLAGFSDFFSKAFENIQVVSTFCKTVSFHGGIEVSLILGKGIHSVGPGELEQTGPDEFKAIFTVIYHAGPKGTDVKNHGTGGGHYHETWKRQGDDWFLADLYMQRLYWITT
ncbi:hypothetical protein Daus18300_007139 [Diaporthe australafricana]|uniref:SnoaL-like domain-containing protein n=1 Tax=Diaporthe australafricana TaxID=127596 RepID=A0ABR3WPA2_9PEZI